jgi:hypothetical protein
LNVYYYNKSYAREYINNPSVVAQANYVPSGENYTYLTLTASFVFLFIIWALFNFFEPGIWLSA